MCIICKKKPKQKTGLGLYMVFRAQGDVGTHLRVVITVTHPKTQTYKNTDAHTYCSGPQSYLRNLLNRQKIHVHILTYWQQDIYIQWNILSHMFFMLSSMLRALGDIMRKNIGSYKQCAVGIWSQLSAAYFCDF